MEQIEKLKKTAGFQDSVMDCKHCEAFYKLIDETWLTEEEAMRNSRIPDIMNNLILVVNTHNKREIETLSKNFLKMQKLLNEIEKQKEK